MNMLSTRLCWFFATLTVLFVGGLAQATEAAEDIQKGEVALTEIVLHDGSDTPAFSWFLGDAAEWRLPVRQPEEVSGNEKVSIASGDQYGGKRLSFKGRGEGQAYLSSAQPQDLTAYEDADAALVFLISVEQPPRRQAVLRMGCGYPCAGNADITKLLKALPVGEWLRLSLDMTCFVNQGLDTSHVVTPYLLMTKGRMGLQVADIRIVPGMGSQATVRC